MKQVFLFCLLLASTIGFTQELYPYTEPASNMPSHSLSAKTTALFQSDAQTGRAMQRYMPELMVGLSKKWMVHAGVNFSDMHRQSLNWEGARLYGKYRFYAADEVHRHFRLAAFAATAYSRNPLERNEINLQMGEQSGAQVGLIATQLWNKFALSSTIAWNEVLANERFDKLYANKYAFRSVSYSLSTGYLLLPFEYKDYNQTNLNLYLELLGGRNIHFPGEKYYVDLAPSVQAIFSSTAKLSLGYRFQLASDIDRLARNGFMASFEYIFLNALK